MSTPSLYSDGTIDVVNGSTAFVGHTTAWTSQLKRGTIIRVGTASCEVASIEDDEHGTFYPAAGWPGVTASGAAYVALTGNDGGEIAEYVRTVFERIVGKGMGIVSPGSPVAADYQSNDLVYDRSSTTLSIKDQGVLKALLAPGNYDAFGDVTNSPSDRDQYDDGQGDLSAYVGKGLTFLSLTESGFYVLLVPDTGSGATWSSLVSIKGPAGAAGSSDVVGTSTTSLAIGTGSKTFTIVETARGWGIGARLRASSNADGANFMEGVVTAYSGTSLTINVDLIGGSGTHTDWTINLAGNAGISTVDATSLGTAINGATGKTTPVDADELPLVDSAASNVLAKLTWANLKATLQSTLRATTALYGLVKIGTEVRETLTADRTYYVRTDGSDSNDGSANDAAHAFLTLQKAWDTIAALDLSIYSATIRIADGTYTAGINFAKRPVGGRMIYITGNTGTPTNVLLSLSSAHCLWVQSAPVTVPITIDGFKMQNTGGGLIRLDQPAIVFLGNNLNFGACHNSYAHIGAGIAGAYVQGSGKTIAISGGGGYHMNANFGGAIFANAGTTTITGTPAFALAFVQATLCSPAHIGSRAYSGSATGKKYDVSFNGVINSGSTLPGDVAGTTATGGQYA